MNLSYLLSIILFMPFLLVILGQNENIKSKDKQVKKEFHVIGISTRTTNENGQSGKDIEQLWGKFWGEAIQDKIPKKVNEDIYAIYTDYESDHTKPYTVIIGLPVHSLDTIPEGFVGISIKEDSYKKFVSKGKMPEAVLNTWMEIWQNKTLKRAYRTDFTVHGKKYYDGDNAEVETFISIIE